MSNNEKFEVSDDWSSSAQINSDQYNDWYEKSFNNNEEFLAEVAKGPNMGA